MNDILDNESFPIEYRLTIAKELLIMKEKQIQKLQDQLDKQKSDFDWQQDQTSINRMGL